MFFLLNTDNTDFTDNLVLPHNGTKASSLDAPPIKRIRVIREIRVQKPYAPRINKEYPCPPKNIRAIRVQNPYAPRLNKDIRVPRQKKNPWFSPPTSPHNS